MRLSLYTPPTASKNSSYLAKEVVPLMIQLSDHGLKPLDFLVSGIFLEEIGNKYGPIWKTRWSSIWTLIWRSHPYRELLDGWLQHSISLLQYTTILYVWGRRRDYQGSWRECISAYRSPSYTISRHLEWQITDEMYRGLDAARAKTENSHQTDC